MPTASLGCVSCKSSADLKVTSLSEGMLGGGCWWGGVMVGSTQRWLPAKHRVPSPSLPLDLFTWFSFIIRNQQNRRNQCLTTPPKLSRSTIFFLAYTKYPIKAESISCPLLPHPPYIAHLPTLSFKHKPLSHLHLPRSLLFSFFGDLIGAHGIMETGTDEDAVLVIIGMYSLIFLFPSFPSWLVDWCLGKLLSRDYHQLSSP